MKKQNKTIYQLPVCADTESVYLFVFTKWIKSESFEDQWKLEFEGFFFCFHLFFFLLFSKKKQKQKKERNKQPVQTLIQSAEVNRIPLLTHTTDVSVNGNTEDKHK